MSYTYITRTSASAFGFRSYSLRVAFQINMALIALSLFAIVVYVFFIAQAVFYATVRTDSVRAQHVLESEVATLEQTYIAKTQSLSLASAESLSLVALSGKRFVEKTSVSYYHPASGL